MYILKKILVVFCAAAATASASTIESSTTGASFYTNTWTSTRVIDNTPGPWFDHPSGDGGNCSIGFYIEGPSSTGCSSQPGGIDRFSGTTYNGPRAGTNGLDFWSAGSSTTSDLAFNFAPDSPYFTVALMAEAAGAYASYKLGFYIINATGQRLNYTLFKGSDPIGAQVNFSPGNNDWGFWFTGNGNTFYTDSSFNTADTTTQHFAVFRDPLGSRTGTNWNKLWIGTEDAVGAANGDWNDMIFTLTCAKCGTGTDPTGPWVATPESGTGSLVVLGGALVFVSRLRRRKA